MKLTFKPDAKTELHNDLLGEVGEVVAQETRDGVCFVSVQFAGVEVCGLPLSYFDEVE